MKKILVYFLGFILLIFIIPALLSKKEISETSNGSITNIENDVVEYDYKKYGEIKLLHQNEQEIETIGLDEYLYNVVSAEMPVSFEKEALKAQAIVARTYTIFKCMNRKHDNADICDDSKCCQAWISKSDRLEKWPENERESNWKKIEACVNETKGKIITYENKPINAFFHSNSGGITETTVNVWGGTTYPYLQSVETDGEEGYSQYASEAIFSQEEIIEKLKEKYSDISIDFSNLEDIKILDYTDSNRVKTIKFGNHNLSGVETRTIFGLKSANFDIIKEDSTIKFSVKGYGHGVGMSQTGADSMAKQGKNTEEIIKHFYTGVEISEVNYL